MPFLSPNLLAIAHIAADAGRVVMRHYESGCEARTKDDRSPVTDADEEAEKLILRRLAEHFPGVAVVAEEEMARGGTGTAASHFFLVDPLDGTREFLSRNGEFTVNIAEVKDGVPVMGAVYAPARNRLFLGALGEGALEMSGDMSSSHTIRVRPAPAGGLVAVGSRSHNDEKTAEYLKQFAVKEYVSAGSSLKFCLVAAGEADIYARAGRTMEWDTAAGQAVLMAAGGSVSLWDGTPFTYGKPGFENPGFVARGK
ncbi:MAG TPA: 3'(2'),5'-bisphosphate nucleotidase CysQ [Rhizomicrobium sp.]|jgi:3'(2'), 5'-bisphosphate nucleotidase|nr:3'(2'),5'-bisphosphate nucleotidase CysQ [Rhizomicrobium sp.]